MGNKILGKVAFLDGFKDIMAIPIIGAERRGAPIKAFLRISNEIIRRIDAVTKPDYIMVLDETLLHYPAIHATIVDTTAIINTENAAKYTFPASVNVFQVPATKISLEIGLKVSGQPIVNIPMIGAFAKATGLVSLETIKKVIEENFGEKAELNFEAAKQAYDNTIEVLRE